MFLFVQRKARNAEMLHNKIKSLLRSYRTACRDIKETGTFSMSPQLFSKIDEIFGNTTRQWEHGIHSNYDDDDIKVERNYKRQRITDEPNQGYPEEEEYEEEGEHEQEEIGYDSLLEITHETNFNETFNESLMEMQEAEERTRTKKLKKKSKHRHRRNSSLDTHHTDSNPSAVIHSIGSKNVFQERLLEKKIAADIEKERLRHQHKLQYLKMKNEMIDKIESNKMKRLNIKLETKMQMHKEIMEKRIKFEMSDD